MVIKCRKIKKIINDYALKLIEGLMTIEEILSYFENNPQSYRFFNKYASKCLYTTLREIPKLKNELGNFNIRVYVYQLFQGYLYSMRINFEIKAPELVFYYSMQDQCPEWFQSDYNVLRKIFPNVDELVKNKTLNENIVKVCQIESVYPVWLQSPNWIIEDNAPLCFVSQSINPNDANYYGEDIIYKFKNKKNEFKYVTQFD